MKKIFLTSLLIVSALWTQNALAATSGSCAPTDKNGNAIGSCTWTLDGDTLTISGNGPMKDYQAYQTPWYAQRNDIISVDISSGITSIGKYSFFQTNITDLFIPASVEVIEMCACSQMGKLKNVVFEEGSLLKKIGAGAFSGDPKLTTFSIPEGVTVLGSNVFALSKIGNLVLPNSLFTNGIGLGQYSLSSIPKVYCPKENIQKCETYFETALICDHIGSTCSARLLSEDASFEIYEKYGNEYYFDGKFYASPYDIGIQKYIHKRSYTPAEAAKVVGDTNTLVFYFK